LLLNDGRSKIKIQKTVVRSLWGNSADCSSWYNVNALTRAVAKVNL